MTEADTPQVEQAEPQNKTQLMARIRVARQALDGAIAGLDAAALSAPGPEGWSVKDHLAHLTSWRRKVIANMDGRQSAESLGVPEDVYQSGDWVKINEIVRAPDKDRPAADILEEYHRVHTGLLQRIEATPEDQLYGADDKLRNNIAGNTYAHDEEHLPWIKTVLDYTQKR
jgi:hypothetical protein